MILGLELFLRGYVNHSELLRVAFAHYIDELSQQKHTFICLFFFHCAVFLDLVVVEIVLNAQLDDLLDEELCVVNDQDESVVFV